MTTDLSRSFVRTPFGGVVLAVFCVAAAFALTVGIQQIAPRAYFILFIPAVMFSTWFGGRASGLFASALTVAATVFLLPRSEIADQLVWVIVAAIVTFGTSAATAQRRHAEDELRIGAAEERVRRRDAESVSQLKTDLLAQVAHELRQPLNAIGMATRLLESPPSDATRLRALGVIQRQSEHLRRLVDDLLDLSGMNRQELQLRKSEIDLCQVIDDTMHVIADDVAARGVALSAAVPPCPVRLHADPTRVRQIVSNLLSNAVKFTPAGGTIEVAVEQTPSQSIVIRVRDTGRGIPADRLPHIFDMFHKGEGGDAGLGVGLAVVKGLAEMHGGAVEARSAGPGRGSEFVVTLPGSVERTAA
jgi:signal transduction histidine kinase